ncbi:SusC/RagA family TonB-linked outer membrane protein [Pontibacter litorisediminis]|uniref:SusC/RagA family TonB-linked outer membrane protein n=1 Tax=Pontibacter litorisediminis TaxID=1846260 RepID=UPI0023ECE14F|nr:TonB-dependent receptor [Pontibacter litorisediminis]
MTAACFLYFSGAAQDHYDGKVALAASSSVVSQSSSTKSLNDVLRDLRNKYGIQYSYKADVAQNLQLQVPAGLAEEQNVEVVLSKVLTPGGLTYKKVNNVYIIVKDVNTAPAATPAASPAKTTNVRQEQTIRGTVTDDGGTPLPGVTVVVKGTTRGTSTDASGNFTLSVPANATLVLSFIGFQTQEVAVGNQATFNIAMQTDTKALEEVVVVGYGTQRKQDVTGSVASLSPKEFNNGVVGTPDQLLAGKVPGLTVNRSSGDPTAGSTIQLRGPSSLTAGSSPFYVIDGVPGASIDLVAPDDIVSMDVLKDASATAIYGSRAANGVIMVTTRRGKAGAPTLSYSGYAALETVANKIDVLSADEYRRFLADNDMEVAASEDGASTDWQEEIYRNGISQNHNIGFSGGNETTRYNASVNYFNNEGIVKRNSLERVIGRLGVDQDMFEGRLRLGLSVVNTMINSNHVDYGIFNGAARFLPVSPVTSDATEYERYGGYFQVPGRTNYFNPVAMLNQRDEERNRNIMLGSAKVGVDILPGLVLDLTGSLQRENYDRNYYMRRSDFDPRALGIGYAEREGLKHTDKIFESVLNYTKNFADRHELKLLGGYSYQNTMRNDGIKAINDNFSSDELGAGNLFAGNGDAALHFRGFPRKEESTLVSFFGRVNYSFDEKYILSATLRRDGSSKFGVNNRWAMFPSFAAAWRISEESFMQTQSLFNDLKLRVGYGISGNQNIPPYRSITLFGPQEDQFLYNGEFINSYSVIQNPNPDLKWESTSMLNVGVDFAILNGRVSGTVEYYDKQTDDLLYEYNVPTPPYQFNRLLANGATMSNKGVEIMLTGEVMSSSNFSWNSSVNFARNKNEVGSLASNVDNLNVTQRLEGYLTLDGWTGQSVSLVEPGLPLGTFYTARYIGYDENTRQTIYQTPQGELVTADQLRTPDDFQIVGQALPKFTYGWSNNFNYKSFDFGFFLRGVYGNKIFNATRADLSRLTQATSFNISQEALEDGIFEAPVASSRWIEDGSFARLEYATLGYNFNVAGLKYLKTARVYVTGQNLFVITDYTGVDPEVSLDGLAPGIDNRNYYPKTRSFLLGVNLSF